MSIFAQSVTEEEFNERFKAALERKFPHIAFRYSAGGKGASITDLVAQGDIPDIIRTDVPTLQTGYLDLGLGQDLTPFVQTHKYDLKRFVPSFVRELTEAAPAGELYGLPVPPYYPMVLYYNKDIFDTFGVAYPKDGMPWEDLVAKARQLSRTDAGVPYRGFSMNYLSVLRDNPFSLPILDPKADQLSASDKWKTIFDHFLRLYALPNNRIEDVRANETNAFAKGNVAMQIDSYSIAAVNKAPKDANWDMAAYPLMEGAPKVTGQRGPAYWSLTKQSKHQDEAFQVIMQMLSDEIQLSDSMKGAPTTLVNPSIQAALGKEHPVYRTKNMKAISYFPPASYAEKRDRGLTDVPLAAQQSLLGDAFLQTASGQKDVNTALRELGDKLKLELDKEKSK
jgi:multiple sugar transport system substrate-binding protein